MLGIRLKNQLNHPNGIQLGITGHTLGGFNSIKNLLVFYVTIVQGAFLKKSKIFTQFGSSLRKLRMKPKILRNVNKKNNI